MVCFNTHSKNTKNAQVLTDRDTNNNNNDDDDDDDDDNSNKCIQ